jgi:hypothetical protein
MLRFFLFISFFFISFIIFAQGNGSIIVYSASGKVELKSGKVKKQVKSYDILTSTSVLVIAENSKLFFIDSDKKMLQYSKPGIISVAKIIASISGKTSEEYGNALSLVIHHFIEKGKSYHAKTSFSSAGVVTRGSEGKLMLFPGNNTFILNELSIRPIFNSRLIDSTSILKIDLLVNDIVKQTYQTKQGESIVLPDDLSNKDEIFLLVSYNGSSEKSKLVVATQQTKNTMVKDLADLEVRFRTGIDLLIAKALYFESKGFYVDALTCYDKLVSQSGNDSDYANQRNSLLRDLISQ